MPEFSRTHSKKGKGLCDLGNDGPIHGEVSVSLRGPCSAYVLL